MKNEIQPIGNQIAQPIQRLIFGEVLGRVSRGEKQQFFDGKLKHLPDALSLDTLDESQELAGLLDTSLLRVIQASRPNGKCIVPELTTAAGGWCSFFTGDLIAISQGVLPNPISGEGQPIAGDQAVDLVADWIVKSIRMDQIVEAIFPLRVPHHVAIEETKLWTQKLGNKLGVILERALEPAEIERLERAIEQASRQRFACTQRFLQCITGRDLSLHHFTDSQIWDELQRARNVLFDIARVSETGKEELATEGLLWTQYTGKYADLLTKVGIIRWNAETVLFSEPIQHATPFMPRDDDPLHQEVAKFFTVIFDGSNTLLRVGGVNERVGQFAMVPCFSRRGNINPATNKEWKESQRSVTSVKGSRQHCTVADLPNIANWQMFLESLDPSHIPERLADGDIFLWSANLLTGDEVAVAKMLKLVQIFQWGTESELAQTRIRELQEDLKTKISVVMEATFAE